MKRPCCLTVAIGFLLLVFSAAAQTPRTTSSAPAQIPRLIRFSGSLASEYSQGVTGVHFSIYRDEDGGTPLWTETQNVSMDVQGRYDVLLGSTKAEGIPADLFTSGEARWLGIQPDSGAELPRVLLVSVPYALKALDAETLGGKPAAAFATVNQGSAETVPGLAPGITPGASSSSPPAVGGSGTINFIPKWTSSSGLGNSALFQSSSSQIGLGTTSPGAKLDVVLNTTNTAAVRGTSNATSGGIGVEGVTGTSTADPGLVGVMGLNKSKFGVAGLFNTTSINSFILEGQYNGHEVFFIDPNGRISATQGVFISTTVNPITAIGNFNNCMNTNTCNTAYLGAGTAAGVFIGQPGGLILQGENNFGTNMFTLDPNGNVHTGSLIVDGINNTDVNGVEAFAFGTGATGVYGEADASGNMAVDGFSLDGIAVVGETTNGLSAHFAGTGGGFCNVDNAGNMGCTGTKSAVVPLIDGRQVALYAVEAPENWFEDFGSGQLRAGAATVDLDAEFAQTVNASVAYHVFVTPNGDCGGLYVAAKTASSFEVRELNGGRSNISFDYRVVARRKGYEKLRMQDLTKREAAARAAVARRIEPPHRSTSKNGP
jgi:hypothetical protein